MTTGQAEPGRSLAGRYRLIEMLGEGGMGRVWQGVDELLDRPVAIKELSISPHLPAPEVEVMRTRMLREARSAAQLSHPSIVTVFDVVDSDDRPWIVMELVRGESLGSVLKRDGTLSPERVAHIGMQVVAALAVAHDRGVVHRDIKPGNVLISAGDRAVLTDFGIALLEGNSNLTSTGQLVGSPSYLAPELAQGGVATPASDMWALGITLFQALEGVTPFERATPMGTLTAIVTEKVSPPASAGPLWPLLERLLNKDPSHRPTVAEAHEALREATRDAGTRGAPSASTAVPPPDRDASARSPEPTPASPPSTPVSSTATGAPGRAARRRWAVPAACGAAAVLAVTGAVLWWEGRTDDSDQAAPAEQNVSSPEQGESPQERNASSPEGNASPSETEPEDSGPDMARHEDDTGFALDVPEGWEMERRDNGVFFHNPSGGYLQVDQTDTPGGNAKEDWEQQEGAISSGFDGYQRAEIVALDEPYVDDYVSAADWEFTFDGSEGRMHAVNRAFHTEDKGYALFLVSPEGDWEENRELLDEMTESFEPAG
ncbi:serine/threonine-protein kinase [Halostreptopolyspora alba]|uniref:non-specific serine/threonine protein kinase n=1 Tax=Halostreptopolyspora alba TaxID=2487137 RepID=A0A3N0EDH7_9ACTN|nr:serine/threonine protein kinase [Nocardiopsaceae bacterium YIM 96095]